MAGIFINLFPIGIAPVFMLQSILLSPSTRSNDAWVIHTPVGVTRLWSGYAVSSCSLRLGLPANWHSPNWICQCSKADQLLRFLLRPVPRVSSAETCCIQLIEDWSDSTPAPATPTSGCAVKYRFKSNHWGFGDDVFISLAWNPSKNISKARIALEIHWAFNLFLFRWLQQNFLGMPWSSCRCPHRNGQAT